MGQIAQALTDGLRNLVSGLGSANDKGQANTYVLRMPTRQEIDACYRGTWLGRKIHDIPALDMTREWRAWQAEDDQIEAIELIEKNLQVRARVRKALALARLYGGSAIIMGLPGASTSAAPEKIGKGQLKYLHVVHRHQLSLGDQVRDLADPMFGQPEMFRLNTGDGGAGADIHPSRVVAFTGAQLPEGSTGALGEDWYWGDPLLVSVFDALTTHDSGAAAIANMLQEAKQDIVHIPGFMDNLTSDAYERTLMERFTLASLLKSITNTLVLDGGDGQEGSGERWEQKQMRWEGLPEIQRTLFQLVSGAADIPATRLVGMSPAGMNATGESDTRNYYDMLSSLQNSDLTPTTATLDEYLIMNAIGERDPSIFYEWNPLWQMTPGEKADRDKKVAETANTYATMGVVPDDAFAVAVQNRLIEDGVFPGLESAIDEADKVARLMQEEPEPGALDPVTGQPIAQPGQPALPAPANSNSPAARGRDPRNGGPAKATGTFSGNSRRRAANDRARRMIADRALPMDDGVLLLTEVVDFNPNHVRSGRNGGEFTFKSTVVFEVAPDPDDKEATAAWNALSDEDKERITEEMTDEFGRKIAKELGVGTFEVDDAYGGFQGEINPSQLMGMDDTSKAFETAGAIGHVFNQKAMVVYTSGPTPGTSPVGMVAVNVPNATAATLRKVQGELGSYAEDGWTYSNGKMQLLNFTGKSDVDLAKEINAKLGDRYRVQHGTIYSAYIERKDYARGESNGRGTAGAQGRDRLRVAFGETLGQKIRQARGRKTGDQGRLTDAYNPNQPRDPGGEGGGQWVSAGGTVGKWPSMDKPPKMPRTKAELEGHPFVQMVDWGQYGDPISVYLKPPLEWSGQSSLSGDTLAEVLKRLRDVEWASDRPPPWHRDAFPAFDRYNPNQPRDPGGEGGGQWIAAGASGEGAAGLDEVEPLTGEAKAAMAEANRGKDVDQIRLEAGVNQLRLRQVGHEIQDAVGVTFAEPPAGFEVKSRESILRKVASENYDGPHQLRDISRATFVVPTAAKADLVIGALTGKGTVYDRGWSRDANSGYAARFVYLKHPNGGVSEIQIVPNHIAQIKMGMDLKSNGQGHILYEIMRDTTKPMDVRRVAARKSRTLYNRVLHKSFYAALGIGTLPDLPGITS